MAKHGHKYARTAPAREPYDTVAIVCEGEKTEPNYLSKLLRTYRLSSANIKVVSPPGTDPVTIVESAREYLADYDKVFCVFDRDSHANFNRALQVVANSAEGQAGQWIAIPSVPCFEVWVLLHFVYTTAPVAAGGDRSPCDNLIRQLLEHFPAYAKGDAAVSDHLLPFTDDAIQRAHRLEADNARTGSSNPSTKMHRLVIYLKKSKNGMTPRPTRA